MTLITVSADSHELFDRIRDYLPDEDFERVFAAYAYATEKHADQRRKSGEAYITHPASVAYYLANYHVDSAALIAALLHDVAEDTPASISEIEALFGSDVAQIVDGVTKFKHSSQQSRDQSKSDEDEAHTATVRKLFQFMTRDVRVVMIKLFDRLHNMRTIGSMPQHKKERIARETLDIYAPLAYRLGIWDVKNELERLSFQIINPVAFEEVTLQLNNRRASQNLFIEGVCQRIEHQLRDHHVKVVTVAPSPRNAYTLYKKNQGRNPYNIVDNIPRILVILPDKISCYAALGLIHELWKPTPSDFHDYIARPRDNLYRALHTTVRHENGQEMKFRLRSEAMAILSDIGVLARWANIGRDMSPEMAEEMAEHVSSLFANIESNISAEDSGTAVQNVMADILGSQITVYTPKGDQRELPIGATALDFAFKIHTQVGTTAHRARVNGNLMPLNVELHDGDMVEILRRSQATQRFWLDEELGFLKMGSTRSALRRHFRRMPERLAEQQGRSLLDAELKMIGLPDYSHAEIADLMGFDEPIALYYELGRADILISEVARRVLSVGWWFTGPTKQIGRKVSSSDSEEFIILGATDVHEKLHLCGNCKPRPGMPIRGYIRRSQRVTVHRLDCHLLAADAQADKLLDLHWGEEGSGEVREAALQIEVYDRPNLLFEITDMLREEHVNISWINTPVIAGRMRVDLCLEVSSSRQLVSLLHRIKSLLNVLSVRKLAQPIKAI